MTLKGTEKQVAWAQDIINAFVEFLDNEIAEQEAASERRLAKKGVRSPLADKRKAEAEELKAQILGTEELDAAKVIKKGKGVQKSLTVEGAMKVWNIETAWKDITR